MAKKILVIDSNDLEHFFLSVEGETLTIGDSPKHPEAISRKLHISAIHCEVEIEEDLVVVSDPPGISGRPIHDDQELCPGDDLDIGHAHLRLESADDDGKTENAETALDELLPRFADECPASNGKTEAMATALDQALSLSKFADQAPNSSSAQPAIASTGTEAPTTHFLKQLLVIDGADKGRSYSLLEAGVTTIGKSTKNADIVLHDLYVARVHCEVEVQGDKVFVRHLEGADGTGINGQRITGQQEIQLGDVLRVGNSQLRLEHAVAENSPGDAETAEAVVDVENIEVLEDETGPEEGQEKTVACESAEAPSTSPAGEGPFQLPHGPVDKLVQLEDQVLGHYQIGKLLGRGHSGLVFSAQDLKSNHDVGLKVLSPDFPANATELQQFVRALKIVPQLHHPNLVTLHAAGKSGPYCWIAREYVEGESVARIIQRINEEGKFNWKRAGRAAVYLARVLAFLHQHKVVHGNITPRNLLVRSDKVIKVADLMLTQALQGSRLQKAIFQKKLLAELPYLAPEQTEPNAFVDHLADLYAVGAVLYTLLTGKAPFTGDSAEEIIHQIHKAKVVKPTKIHQTIPISLEVAVLKLLAKHQEDRYQNAEELLADVEPIAREHEIKV